MKNSLRSKIWLYLIIFSASILIFLWVFQILFLNTYYESFKISKLKSTISKVQTNYDQLDYTELLDSISKEDEVCIEIIENDSTKYLSMAYNKGCMGAETTPKSSMTYKKDFINSGLNEKSYSIINPRYNNKTIVYGIKLSDTKYAFISASLVPIDTTITVLKNQFIYVTLLVILLSLVISYFISKRISNPISKISKEARKLANGDSTADFKTDNSILEIKELSETLEMARDELAKTENLRRELMANVSHDLKTPLTMIKAYAEMIRDVSYKDKKKREQNLNVIIEETDRLNLLVNDILELSKIQSNTQELKYETFDLKELINNIINRYDIWVSKENYVFNINLPQNDVIVNADKKRIEQVIYNLINNALNYTGDDKAVIINVIDNDNCVRVEVKDTGKGIDAEELYNIWDKYYKIDKTHSRVQVGTGLGLSIVKNILINHGYNFGVDSAKKKGTTFYFEIKKIY